MSSASNRETIANAAKELTVVNWPMRDQPIRALVFLVAAAAIAVYGSVERQSITFGVVIFLVFAVCLWRVWIPVRFELGPRGITQHVFGRSRRIGWRDVARCEFRRHGVLLVPDDDASVVNVLRGLFIRFPRDAQKMRELLEFYLSARTRAGRAEDSESRRSSSSLS